MNKIQQIKNKEQKGITLIALIITIIVMLILVAVTINMAVNGGLFEYAGKAAGEMQNAINEEQRLANGGIQIGGVWYDSIDDYLAGNPSADQSGATGGGTGGGTIGGTTGGDDEGEDIVGVDGEIFTALYTENKEYTDENGDTAVIPKGFSVGKSEGINTVDEGLVIQDEDGNQFVWIPVEVSETDTETSIASFYRSEWSNNARTTGLSTNYKEPYASGYTEEATEYNAMVKSVYENEGFYIGRFEAGSTTARTETANGTTEMVVKRDVYPYNYVAWGMSKGDYTSNIVYKDLDHGLGALALSKAMYENEDVGVTSTLCYGIQWDAMLDFIKSEKNVTSSVTWGNYVGNSWTITRASAKYSSRPSTGSAWGRVSDEEGGSLTKGSSSEILLTTGACDDFGAKNIYDVAGNLTEITNELYSYSYCRVWRSTGWDDNGASKAASYRYGSYPVIQTTGANVGFRVTLYLSSERV